MTGFIFAEWQEWIAVCLGSAIVTAPGLFFFPPPILEVFLIWVEKNILTHKKKERSNTRFFYHIHASSSLKMMELHWSNDTSTLFLTGFICATLLPDTTHRQGTPPTALRFPTSLGWFTPYLPLFYWFECLFVWVFNIFLISLRHRKPVLPWGRAHCMEGCAAKLDTRERIHCKAGCSPNPLCQNGNPRQVRALGVKLMQFVLTSNALLAVKPRLRSRVPGISLPAGKRVCSEKPTVGQQLSLRSTASICGAGVVPP